jgi:hypothetical protein
VSLSARGEFPDRGCELGGFADDWESGGEEAGGGGAPARVGRIQQVDVVDDGAEGLDTEVLGGGDPLADGEVGVPEVRGSGVVEEACVPGGALVGGQDGCPDGVDAELCGRVLLEDFLADPTGPGEAGASGGREEEQQSG